MKLDIYKRPELQGQFSFMVVPEGEIIPEEATGTEWEIVARGREINDPKDLSEFSINKPFDQVAAKGYAITAAKDFVEGQLSFQL